MKARDQVPAIGAASVGTGAVLTALIASACCVSPALAPMFLSILGAAGLVAVSGLRPFTPWLLLASALLLAWSFRLVFAKSVCVRPGVRSTTVAFLVARIFVVATGLIWCASAAYAVYGLLHE